MPAVPSTEPSPFPIADAAQTYLDRRRWLLVRLERIERALRRWDAWETNALLPEDLHRPVIRPMLPREVSDGRQRLLTRLLTEELARLDSAPTGEGAGAAPPRRLTASAGGVCYGHRPHGRGR